MMESHVRPGVNVGGLANAGAGLVAGVRPKNIYTFEAYDPLGNLKWVETAENLVTLVGLDDILDKYLKGSGYTAAWYVGLIVGGTSPQPAPAAGDTMSSHAGWTEFTTYTASSPNVRPTLTLGTVASQSVDNSASKASYVINVASPDSQIINGGFLVTDSEIGGTAGILYSAAVFTGGQKQLNGNDTLNVTVTCTAASS